MKTSPGPAKLSQKQRKILAMANKEASVESNISKPTQTVAPSKSSGKAWWVTNMSALLISLRFYEHIVFYYYFSYKLTFLVFTVALIVKCDVF